MIPQAGHAHFPNPYGYVWGSQVLARPSPPREKAEAGSVGESHGAAGLDLRNLHWDNGYPAREQERQRQGGKPWWAASVPMLLPGCGRLRFGLEGKPPKPPTRKKSQWDSRPWAKEIKILGGKRPANHGSTTSTLM